MVRRGRHLGLMGFLLAWLLAACTASPPPTATSDPSQPAAPTPPHADVTAVTVSGEPGAYQFSVTVTSPDTGCAQFADWWEVLSEDGKLLYRRVLLHSHVDEQPFTRSGGPVAVSADTIVIVRAHMNIGGYGGAALQGAAADGFEPVALEAGFAADVEMLPPLPEGCAF